MNKELKTLLKAKHDAINGDYVVITEYFGNTSCSVYTYYEQAQKRYNDLLNVFGDDRNFIIYIDQI